MRRRTLLAAIVVGATGLAGCPSREGDGGGATPTDGAGPTVTSSAFADGGALPTRHSCDGAGVSPPLAVSGVPDAAETLALVVDDPDAPTEGSFVHWPVWNVPADLPEWPAGVEPGERASELDDAPQGTNDGGDLGYAPACPPEGDGAHRYRFTVHAVDGALDLQPGGERAALESALDGAMPAMGRLVGPYQRD